MSLRTTSDASNILRGNGMCLLSDKVLNNPDKRVVLTTLINIYTLIETLFIEEFVNFTWNSIVFGFPI